MSFDQIVIFYNEDIENLLMENASPTSKYNSIFSIPKENAKQAIEMSQIFVDCFDSAGENKLKFNLEKAKVAIQKRKSMTLTHYMDKSVVNQHGKISVAVDQVIGLVKDALKIALTPGDQLYQTFAKTITDGFTNVKKLADDNYIVWEHSSEHKTTYEYHALFSIANKTTGAFMCVIPMALTITVDISKSKLFFITVQDVHNYSLEVKALEVVEALQ
ncbi:hypothetical protein [Photorhabdus laumondii]|uniref:Delta-endotoxin CytB n=1 Tax=Photorhabdus laumondii subsp. clarkei TaxID=2029685 RepID=A0A329VAY6_9GAMM|nr:hypothetical protein [Photorhabdus laumondii]RAW85951.1 hypothetical protein CKY01_18760 [Photorhabdus laumondii subsp. clarkei]